MANGVLYKFVLVPGANQRGEVAEVGSLRSPPAFFIPHAAESEAFGL